MCYLDPIETALAALYAPGSESGRVGRWPGLVAAMREGKDLAGAGFKTEASALREGWDLAEERLESGKLRTVLSGVGAWLWPAAASARSVPVFWSSDSEFMSKMAEMTSQTSFAGIGARRASREALAFAGAVGEGIAARGGCLVSGGAEGSDGAFAQGHGSAVAVLPHGIEVPRPDLKGYELALSSFAPGAAFSAGQAMERNRLIVLAGEITFVASAGLREGGSWRAAMDGLRAGTIVAVYVGRGAGEGAEELARYGALPVGDTEEALALMDLVRASGREGLHTRWAVMRGRPDARAQPPLPL